MIKGRKSQPHTFSHGPLSRGFTRTRKNRHRPLVLVFQLCYLNKKFKLKCKISHHLEVLSRRIALPQILVSRNGTHKEREREQEIFHWSRRREISLNGSIKRCMHNQLRSFMVSSSSPDRSAVSDSPQGQGSNNSTKAVGKIFRPLKMVTIPQPFRTALIPLGLTGSGASSVQGVHA